MDFERLMEQAWTDHAVNAPTVAGWLDASALALVTEASQVSRLAHLAHHVYGEHLGRWDEGQRFLQQLGALPVCVGQADAEQAIRRYIASLRLAAGQVDQPAGFDASERIRVTALAASNLAARDAPRARDLLDVALAQAERAQLAAADPSHRTLAIVGNGIAATLEELPTRCELQRDLMIRAAQLARRHWAIAGTWLETERAEYRLARSWQEAGDMVQARQHAQNCLEIVRANGNVPLEAFFGWEALGRVERSTGNVAGHAQALHNAQLAFAALAPDDQAWCRASLDTLAQAL